jgi:hypothetical protein
MTLPGRPLGTRNVLKRFQSRPLQHFYFLRRKNALTNFATNWSPFVFSLLGTQGGELRRNRAHVRYQAG